VRLLFDQNEGVYYTEGTYAEKDIPKGAKFRWDPEKKRWWTKELDKAMSLFDYAVDIARRLLIERYTDKAIARKESFATDAKVDFPVPEGLEYLPFQKAGIAYALNRPNVLCADEMGLGKTIEAIGVMNALGLRKALVICKATLKDNWKNEMTKWLVDKSIKIQIINGRPGPITGDSVVVNFEQLSANLDVLWSIDWDILIVDECHLVKNPKAQRSASTYHLMKKAKRNFWTSGTPILNRPVELFPILNQMGVDFAQDFWSYASKYCDPQDTGYGWDFSGSSNLDDLQNKLRETIMIRRMKADVMPELPAKRRQVIELPANTAALRALVDKQSKWLEEFNAERERLKTAALGLKDVDEDKYSEAVKALTEYSKAGFEEMSRIRRETAVAKIPIALEYLESILEETDKVVVFAHHREVLEKLKDKFGDKAVLLYGGTKISDRQAMVDSFQQDAKIKVFLGSIQASGVGITLTAAQLVVFVELDWVPANLSQAEDRLHRIGQRGSVLVQHLVVNGSIDANLAKKVVAKQSVIDKALNRKDGERKEDEGIQSIKYRPTLATDSTGRVTVSNAEAYQPGLPGLNRRGTIQGSASYRSYQDRPNFKEVERPVEDRYKNYDEEYRNAVHLACKMLAGVCDGAVALDGQGYNATDTGIGHQFAEWGRLTDKQVAAAVKFLRKYRRQLPEDLYEKIYPVRREGDQNAISDTVERKA
jgi:SWI/SNF-related matrix-associated actin-dependent regulator of chromatin subfamily A-like protein 1